MGAGVLALASEEEGAEEEGAEEEEEVEEKEEALGWMGSQA